MPTYTYRCKKCEYQFDQRQSFSEDALTECPSCGAEQGLRKVVNSVGIVFKGSGFYVTDNKTHKNGQNDSPAKKEGKESSDSAKSDTATKSESKSSSEKSSAPKEKSSTQER